MAHLDETVLHRLKYRRQFLFGPRPVSLEGDWQIHRITPDWVLTIQRDLAFRCAEAADGAELLLLGFLIDPDFPELTDQQLFERLCQCRGWEEVLRATLNLSGRWVIFHISQHRVRVVNDAGGLRSVFFSVAGQEPWCFSQPGLYRLVHPVEYSLEALAFIRSRECQKDFEAVWPPASSPYGEVAHLLANHYLDLETRATTRFWPTARLELLDMETAMGECARILQQSMRAITARGRIAFGLTAGWDSRLLLAGSREVADRMWFHTAIHGELNRASPDLHISAAICQAVGLKHHWVPCPRSMSEPFKSIFMKNHDPAHPVWGRICQGLLAGYPDDALCVRGNVSEVARCHYYHNGVYPEMLRASDLPRVVKMPSSEFVQRHFDVWFAGAAPMVDLGYKTLDLLYWEQRIAKWLGISQTEYDIVHDTFSPYSNRKLLSTMLATPIAARTKPHCTLYRDLIQMMWPELLQFPFNPPTTQVAKLLHKARKAKRQISGLLGRRPNHVRLRWHDSKAARDLARANPKSRQPAGSR